jgi:hypothetical protein
LEHARANGLPNDFAVKFINKFMVRLGASGSNDLRPFDTFEEAQAFAEARGGQLLGGRLEGSTATIFASGASPRQMLQVTERLWRAIPMGSRAAGVEFTIWHEYGHYLLKIPQSEDWRANAYAMDRMRIK